MAGVMLKQRLCSWPRSVTQCVLFVLALCAAGLVACKKKPTAPLPVPESSEENGEVPALETGNAAPSAASPSPSQGPVAIRCRELPHTSPFRIGEVVTSRAGKDKDDAEDGGPDEDDEVPDPYAVELGPARADAEGFVLSVLRSLKGQSHALIALLAGDAASGKVVDLGVVHGDPDPPAFVTHGKDLLIATPDTDAGGGMLKIGLVHDARGSAQVHWGPELSGVRRDSTFALEASGERAFLAYAADSAGKIRVFGVSIDPNHLTQKIAPEPLSAAGADVDSPRLALRKGGYWLAVLRALDAPKTKPKPAPPSAGSTDLAEGDSLLDIGTGRIEVMKLDAQGKPVSSALVVTAPGARPMSLDLAAAADGGAYIGFRGDDSTPGADGGALELVHVKPDGSFEKLTLGGELEGTGTPSLLVDSVDPGKLWLSAAGQNGATWFGRLSEHSTLAPDGFVRGGDLIAARGGQLLLSRTNGTAADLSVVQCAD
jgi:hypothetical protein